MLSFRMAFEHDDRFVWPKHVAVKYLCSTATAIDVNVIMKNKGL